MTTEQILEKLKLTMKKSSTVAGVNWEGISTATPIQEIGFDSLAILDLLYDIQQDFNLEFAPEELGKVKTVGELAAFLREKGA
jgi:acyl carrier protein